MLKKHQTVDVVNNMEKNIRSMKSNILWPVYQQGQIDKKIKIN